MSSRSASRAAMRYLSSASSSSLRLLNTESRRRPFVFSASAALPFMLHSAIVPMVASASSTDANTMWAVVSSPCAPEAINSAAHTSAERNHNPIVNVPRFSSDTACPPVGANFSIALIRNRAGKVSASGESASLHNRPQTGFQKSENVYQKFHEIFVTFDTRMELCE
jgi:hypothetical protein